MAFFIAVTAPAIPPAGLQTKYWTHGEAYATYEAAEQELKATFPRMWIMDGVAKVVEAPDAEAAVRQAEE